MPDVDLVPLDQTHAGAMLRWVSDPDVARNLGLRSEPSWEGTQRWLQSVQEDQAARGFAVLLEQQHVANVVLDQIDAWVACARMSVYVGDAKHRGTGVGRAAVKSVLHYAFHNLELNKVWLTVHVRNVAAIRLYASLGFDVEGVLREEFLLDGERVDVLRMAVMRERAGQA